MILIAKWYRDERLPIEAGIGPVRLLFERARKLSFSSEPSSATISPDRVLLIRSSVTRSEQYVRLMGIMPCSELNDKSRSSRRRKEPISGGILPKKPLFCRVRFVRYVRLVMEGEMKPPRPKELRSKAVTLCGCCSLLLLQETPFQLQTCLVWFHELRAPEGSWVIWLLKARSESISVSFPSKIDGVREDAKSSRDERSHKSRVASIAFLFWARLRLIRIYKYGRRKKSL